MSPSSGLCSQALLCAVADDNHAAVESCACSLSEMHFFNGDVFQALTAADAVLSATAPLQQRLLSCLVQRAQGKPSASQLQCACGLCLNDGDGEAAESEASRALPSPGVESALFNSRCSDAANALPLAACLLRLASPAACARAALRMCARWPVAVCIDTLQACARRLKEETPLSEASPQRGPSQQPSPPEERSGKTALCKCLEVPRRSSLRRFAEELSSCAAPQLTGGALDAAGFALLLGGPVASSAEAAAAAELQTLCRLGEQGSPCGDGCLFLAVQVSASIHALRVYRQAMEAQPSFWRNWRELHFQARSKEGLKRAALEISRSGGAHHSVARALVEVRRQQTALHSPLDVAA